MIDDSPRQPVLHDDEAERLAELLLGPSVASDDEPSAESNDEPSGDHPPTFVIPAPAKAEPASGAPRLTIPGLARDATDERRRTISAGGLFDRDEERDRQLVSLAGSTALFGRPAPSAKGGATASEVAEQPTITFGTARPTDGGAGDGAPVVEFIPAGDTPEPPRRFFAAVAAACALLVLAAAAYGLRPTDDGDTDVVPEVRATTTVQTTTTVATSASTTATTTRPTTSASAASSTTATTAVSTAPSSTAAPSRPRPTSRPATTVPPTTVPPETTVAPEPTVPATTEPPSTAPPTWLTPTTAPPPTSAPSTAPPDPPPEQTPPPTSGETAET